MPISRSTTVAATPDAVFDLVSDLPRMGELSPENTGGHWLGGATGATVGARFRGSNRHGWRRWSTTARVEVAAPGREFTFGVTSFGIPVSQWRYEITPTDEGCTVTETWTDRRPGWFKGPAGLATGVMDRESATERSLEATLAAVQARLQP